jgi:hypothetical protein
VREVRLCTWPEEDRISSYSEYATQLLPWLIATKVNSETARRWAPA